MPTQTGGLDVEIVDAQAAYIKGRNGTTVTVVQERKSYRDTGGRD